MNADELARFKEANARAGKPCPRHPEWTVDPGYTCALCEGEAYKKEHGIAEPTPERGAR